ncbi:hypothetical protein D3C76_872830 [compost metagenome]
MIQVRRQPQALAVVEHPQHAQHHQQPRHRLVPPEARGRQAADQLRTEQHDQPGQVDPQQEQRHRGEGAVDQLIAGEQPDVHAEHRLGRLEQQRGEQPADQRVADRHPRVGHRRIEQGEGRDAEQQRHEAQQHPRARQRMRAGKHGQRGDVGRHGEAGAEQQRPQAEDRPVEQEAHHAPARLADPPDLVEGALDGHQHGEGGDRQEGHAQPGQMPRLHREVAQVGLHRLAGGGHEMAEDEHLDTLAHALECRDGGQHGEGHGHHRHHREQRGIGQGGGLVGGVVGEEALDQIVPEVDQALQAPMH